VFYLLLILTKILKINQFKYRYLTENEIRLARTVFSDLIDYQKVIIMNQPYLPWQPVGVFMAPNGYIHVKDANYSFDYAKENLSYQSVFIHELTHVYQHQQKINVLLKGALLQIAYHLSFKKYNPYQYELTDNKAFFDYNIEQQGDIAKDIFLKKIKNIILNT